MAKRIPIKTRRLTREEAARLGVSYGAKRQVAASVKQVTSNTKLYSNRQAHEAQIRARARAQGVSRRKAAKLTKEAYTAKRKPVTRATEKGGQLTYQDISRRELMSILRRNKSGHGVLIVHAERGGKYKNKGKVWTHAGSDVDFDTLLNPHGFNMYLEEAEIDPETADRFGVVIAP